MAAKGGSSERRFDLRSAPGPLPAQLAGTARSSRARRLRRLREHHSRHQLVTLRHGARSRLALPRAHVSAQRGARQARPPLQRYARKPADRHHRLGGRHSPVAAARPRFFAQSRADAARLGGARARRAAAHVSSGHRRDPVRQGGRLRCACRSAGADRRIARIPLQAGRRGSRGNVDEAGRGRARDRLAVPLGRHHGRAAADHAALHRLLRLSARLQPAQLGAGRAGRRRRHRRNAIHRVPAVRLRLRADHRHRDHRRGDDRRDRIRLDAEAVPVSAPVATAPVAAPLRQWHRFTVTERLLRSTFYVVTVIAIVWSIQSIEIIPEFLYDAPQQTLDLFARMWPIDWAWYPKVVHAALIETLHTATLGTILAVILASMVALLAARNLTHSAVLNLLARFILVATRSIHAIVWALFFVAVFGPGALAGTLAIAVHSIGFTGKFLSEAIEEAKPGQIEALTAAGAPPLAVLLKGYWPQVKPAFLAISLFRWDINVRESAVLGLVGGGGLGVALDTALSNLYWDQVGLVLVVIFAVVIVAEIGTAWIRSRII